jgi:hypothetical protein
MPSANFTLFKTQGKWDPHYHNVPRAKYFEISSKWTFPEVIRGKYTNDTVPRVEYLAESPWGLNDQPEGNLYGFGIFKGTFLQSTDGVFYYTRVAIPISDFAPRFKRAMIARGYFASGDAQEGKVYIWVNDSEQIMVFAPGFTEPRRVAYAPGTVLPVWAGADDEVTHGHEIDHEH